MTSKPYEVHITISPVFERELESLKAAVEPHGFKVADLVMIRDRKDTPETLANLIQYLENYEQLGCPIIPTSNT